MVNQGIVLGHLVSNKGIEVDKAKVELISKLPPPPPSPPPPPPHTHTHTNVKAVRQFLGHAGFYKRFIKDFSKIEKPLYKLLEKDTKFAWDETCQKSFEELKPYLTIVPIVRASN